MKQLLKHYQSIKAKYGDAILLFRDGDYYQTFNEDAKILALHSEVELRKTGARNDIEHSASLPFHALDVTLRRLVKGGYRVAVCDLLEDPKSNRKRRQKRNEKRSGINNTQ